MSDVHAALNDDTKLIEVCERHEEEYSKIFLIDLDVKHY